MKKIILSFFIVSIVLINAITLDEYVELALKNSNEFRLARIEFLQSEMALKIAHGGFLPEVNFTLKGPDYSWNRNYINFLGYANRMELIAETNNLSGGLDISQSLPFSGNLRISNGLKKYSSDYNLYNNVKEYDLYTNINLLFPILEEDTTKKNIKRKKVEYEIAKNNYEQKLKSIKKEAITLYTEAQMNKVKENIAKEELENSKKLYSITKDKLDIGTASEIDLLDNDILVSQKEIMLNEAKNNRLSAVKKMGDYVNTTNEINVEIGQIELFQKKIPQYENLVNTALKNDQTINNYQITLRELKSELHYLVFRQYFSASIGAGYNFDGRGDSVSDTFNDYKKSNWYGYLLLNIPIFDASVKALNVTIKKTAFLTSIKQILS